ncbi:hypothetical protein P171DRAFT_487887 [Karstenula rhodostoma CBS 690.94]|uniref:Uncharacterized protein n=1 Tax=Karstenula rhodostoma CBS 690.94 TaxID=1392251 RepID=A0A9P4U8P6_9PLEO|nr:hypothetical protein P171DRAFT_487887 [Karstenula rhodostoma CBS 690.94]
MSKRQDQAPLSFDPTYPSGGSWYACGDIFLGCCAYNACTPTGCSEGNLYPVAFNSTQYKKFPDASCGSGSKFYTCGFGPTFWGCCKSNPCNTGAVRPDSDLAGAFVGNPAQEAYYMGVTSEVTSATSSSSSTTSTSASTPGTLVTSTSTSSATGTTSPPTATAVASSPEPASHTAGGGVVVALLVCWLVYHVCYVKQSREKHQDGLSRRQSDLAITTMAETPAPPGYSSPNPNTYPYPHDGMNNYTYPHGAASPVVWKPQHRHGVSELSGETAWRGELESPVPSSRVGSAPQSPPQSPRFVSGDEASWSEHGEGNGRRGAPAVEMQGGSRNGDGVVRSGERRMGG